MSAPMSSGSPGTDPMEASALAPQINRNYKASSAFQWVREGSINSIQAGATYIEYTTEWEAVRVLGFHRRAQLDNGGGMSGQEMPGFINKYGGSGKTVGEMLENFGVGLKSSTLKWNPNGLVVISKNGDTFEDGDGNVVPQIHMMWMHFDAAIIKDGIVGDYGARRITHELLDLTDQDDQDWLAEHARSLGTASKHAASVLPLHEFNEAEIDSIDWVKVAARLDPYPTGTMLVLLGSDDDPHTVLGDPNRNESGKYGIVEYLNTKLWEVPKGVTIKARQYEVHGRSSSGGHDTSKWPVNEKDPRGTRQHRNGRSLKTDIESTYAKYGLDRGEFVIPVSPSNPVEVRGEAFLFKPTIFTTGGNRRSDTAGVPLLTVRHSAHDHLFETFNTTKADTDLDKWISVKAVRDRVVIVLEPLDGGAKVFPNTSRGALLYEDASEGGAPLPINVWADYFKRNPPSFIAKAIKDYYADIAANGADSLSDEDYDRLGQRFGQMLRRVKRWIVPKGGTGTTDGIETDKDANTGQRKRRIRRRGKGTPTKVGDPDPTGTDKLEEREVNVSIIQVLPDNATAMQDAAYFLKLDQQEMVGTMNQEHVYYTTALDAVLEKYAAQITSTNLPACVAAFKKGALSHCALALTAQWNLSKEHPARSVELLMEAALTAAGGGIRHLMQAGDPLVAAALKGKGPRSATP